MNTIFRCDCGIDQFVRVQRFHVDGPIVKEEWSSNSADSLPTIRCIACQSIYELFAGSWRRVFAYF